MRLFLDTNVFVAAVTDEPETGEIAAALLSADHEFLTSTLNLMELRTVLTKKQRLELSRANTIQTEITQDVAVVIPDASDMMDANRLQQETLLYPLDCLILACSQGHDAELVSFDTELETAGALAPADLLD
ncbi:VapC toxin family PIN domain ribonuclease [Natrinema sp. CBA1119]|uniref:type II toxin-antitoxin system VapC family toxin n=1 Tax=Natrinema sp. CBA1119 TaxID=1608465 RepID=UPI000BF5C5CD|nr:PIN domain-containing protein [Natrinema sp. CBA1119]PGF17171.1 VapC toxin family PIN domain ribonuclease [Natrinema sp. CBA1119]